MNKIQKLAEIGQAIWLDYIRRSFVTSGELQDLVEQGLGGVTSNPSIFEKAIAGSTDYDEELGILVEAGRSVSEIYEQLITRDIQMAADVLRPIYEETEGADGFVSLEVSPQLAHDTEGTLAEARHLFSIVDRPNVMIKVPATEAGIPAIRELIGEGLNVNITLMFSLEQYEAVADAYISGLEDLAAAGGIVDRVASVASFFVSRVDTQVDRRLDEIENENGAAATLRSRIGIANAKWAYQRFRELLDDERWERLAAMGARPQRVLWASTSVKDPSLPDTLYVDELIGPDVVNTVPPHTLQAFLDHGTVAKTVTQGVEDARGHLEQLEDLGIDLSDITEQLLADGLDGFARSFEKLHQAIEEKCQKQRVGWAQLEPSLGEYSSVVKDALAELESEEVLSRIWSHDHTVWAADPKEITNRLGWLHIPLKMSEELPEFHRFRDEVRSDGFTRVVLLGMGGSSLAPQVYVDTFGASEGGLALEVLDSTHPEAILRLEEGLELDRTLFLVATKSGGTVETLSFFKYFYNRVVEEVGEERAGGHFAAITDPGSSLVDLANQYRFRRAFLNDPNLGGRYSALSYFGLVPAALLGLDLENLLDRAMAVACGCESCVPLEENPAALLGATLAELAKGGLDKLTLFASPGIARFGDWVEQLIAESTGKAGTGILPVVGEEPGSAEDYAQDRLFVHLQLEEDQSLDGPLEKLKDAGHPLVRFNLRDSYDLGGQIFLWELATAIAGHRLGIHPFNQPNVESAKVLARKMVSDFQKAGRITGPEPTLTWHGLQVFGQDRAQDPGQALRRFLAQADSGGGRGHPRSYIALQAYLDPTPEIHATLMNLQVRLRDHYRLATTLGFGPRFLHSTGQLHKGDGGNGLFIQLTADPARDISIPDRAGEPEASISFAVLLAAQALGDRQALLDAGRRVIRFDLGSQVPENLQVLLEAIP